MTHDDIARICHEANRALCECNGDFSQVVWAEAPEWQKDSAKAGVKFRDENPAAPASATHDAWSATKIADGWTYGPEKDASIKQHPCLVPFDQLPPHQRAKDVLFGGICAALLPIAQPPIDDAHVAPGAELFTS
jgi:hypothetical protein